MAIYKQISNSFGFNTPAIQKLTEEKILEKVAESMLESVNTKTADIKKHDNKTNNK